MSKKFRVLLFMQVSWLITLYARFNRDFAEFYVLKVYPVFAKSLSLFTSVNFSLAEFIIIVFVITAAVYFFITLIKTVARKSSRYFKNFLLNIAVLLSVVYFIFVIFCGINYYRYEFTYYSGLEVREYSRADLINLCEILINDANETRSKLNKAGGGTAKLFEDDYYKMVEKAKKTFDNISEQYEVLKGDYPAPKAVFFSKVMSHFQITGMFFPFTFEANVNADIPAYQMPSTMLHELTHLRGFMREEDANFISYIACINSGFNDFAYSGIMLALSYSMNALYEEDLDAYERLGSFYSDDVKKDLMQSANYWRQFDTIAVKISDIYLKSNNQKNGVKSYGGMVDLLLAYYSDAR